LRQKIATAATWSSTCMVASTDAAATWSSAAILATLATLAVAIANSRTASIGGRIFFGSKHSCVVAYRWACARRAPVDFIFVFVFVYQRGGASHNAERRPAQVSPNCSAEKEDAAAACP